MNKGFTLLEIIATLILLGALTTVIVPRYVNMMQSARVAALQRAVAAGQSQVTKASGKYLLATGTLPTAMSDLNAVSIVLATDMGDYTLSYADAGAGVDITAQDEKGYVNTGHQPWPQPW